MFDPWREVQGPLQQQGRGGPLAERLKTEFGSGVDPQVTLGLGAEGSPKGDSSSEVLSRLAGRGPPVLPFRLGPG